MCIETTLFRLEIRFRTSPASGRQFPKVEICSKVCMNETYPNISERRVVFFGHSAGRAARGGQTRGRRRGSTDEEHVRTREDRPAPSVSHRIARFEQGHWNVLVYELSATVIHLAVHHVYVPGRYSRPWPLFDKTREIRMKGNFSR